MTQFNYSKFVTLGFVSAFCLNVLACTAEHDETAIDSAGNAETVKVFEGVFSHLNRNITWLHFVYETATPPMRDLYCSAGSSYAVYGGEAVCVPDEIVDLVTRYFPMYGTLEAEAQARVDEELKQMTEDLQQIVVEERTTETYEEIANQVIDLIEAERNPETN